MVILALIFALVYGDEEDQEILTVSTVVMMIVSVVSFSPISAQMKSGMMTKSYISGAIVVLLAFIVIYVGRSNRRNQYEQV